MLFGQQPRRGQWPVLSHTWEIFSSFSFFLSVPSPKALIPVSKLQPQSLNPSLKAPNLASRLQFQPRGSYCDLEAPIPALILQSQPQGTNPSFEAPIPALRLQSQLWSSNTSVEAPVPALRLQFQPPGSNSGLEAGNPALRLQPQPRGSNPSLMASIPASWLKSQPQCSNLSFGKGSTPSHQLTLNSAPIEWVEKWKYLGVTLLHGRHFSCCADETVLKYYRAVNSVLRVDGRSDDIVMFRLIEAHCVPILSYAIEVVNITDRRQMSRMRAAYNSVFRKLFNYSMIFLVWNIIWGHNSKSFWDNWIPKKVSERYWKSILWCLNPQVFLQKSYHISTL